MLQLNKFWQNLQQIFIKSRQIQQSTRMIRMKLKFNNQPLLKIKNKPIEFYSPPFLWKHINSKSIYSSSINNLTPLSNSRYFFSNSLNNNQNSNKSKLNAYLRLCRWHQPIGAMLLYWPTAWGVCLGSQGTPNLYLLLLFLMGSWTARSAGCIVNDYFDKDFDKKVQRTKNRPLASGEVTHKQAGILLFLNLCGGLFVLLNLPMSVLMITIGYVALSAIYPLAKRYTNYPQLVLGIVFNSGIIIGCLTSSPTIYIPAMMPIYIGAIAWTLIYDTVYAYQDLEDDLKIGVKSTAVTWNNKNPITIMQQLAIMIGVCHLILPFFDIDFQYSFILMLGLDILLFLEIGKLNLKSRTACGIFFRKNNLYGFGIFFSLALYGLVKQWRNYCQKNAIGQK